MYSRLQKFRVLAEEGSFTRAASLLHITQPALTMAVAKLERELGAQLIVRGEKGLLLTPAGRIVYEAACHQDSALSNMSEQLKELAGQKPRLRIGMVDAVASLVSREPVLLDCMEATADVSLVVNNSRYLAGALQDGSLDCCFVIKEGGTLVEPMVMVSSATIGGLVNEQLANGSLEQFISYDIDSSTYKLIQDALNEIGVHTRAVYYSTSPNVMRTLVCGGRGAAVLPYSDVKSLVATGELAVTTVFGRLVTVSRPLTVIVRPNNWLPVASQKIIHDIETTLKLRFTEHQAELSNL